MKQKGNLLLTFILLTSISAVILSFIYIIIGRTRDIGYEINRSKSFYIAQAGLNKAIWYLITPTGIGGKGNSWRTAGSTEGYAGGQYTMIVQDGPSQSIVITSTGEINSVSRTLQEKISSSSLPLAFNYALYGNGNVTLRSNTMVKGDLFANGNISAPLENHPTGESYVTSGHTVNGVPGTVPDPIPPMPTLNTSYYDQQIATARTYPSGNQNISDMDLGGATIYVNGNANISGNITGGGSIIAVGTTSINGATISSNTNIISNREIHLSSNTNIQSNSVLYSPDEISISGNSRISGSVLSGEISVSGNTTIYGIMYSWEETISLSGSVYVYGSVVNPASSSYNGNITIEFDPAYLPSAPPGLSSGGYSLVKGSWQEL